MCGGYSLVSSSAFIVVLSGHGRDSPLESLNSLANSLGCCVGVAQAQPTRAAISIRVEQPAWKNGHTFPERGAHDGETRDASRKVDPHEKTATRARPLRIRIKRHLECIQHGIAPLFVHPPAGVNVGLEIEVRIAQQVYD